MSIILPTYADVIDARERLRGMAHVTPVVTSTTLDALTNTQVFLKCETFQRIGAFKFRGAYNAISRLSEAEQARGVLAYSSGNHAQAVAKVCALLGIHATIVMPDNAPVTKRAATEGYGATVAAYDPAVTKREELAARLAAEHGYALIPPFDHPDVIAGQGTAALELLDVAPDLDTLLVPCGGGGLLSGSALAVKGRAPGCRVVGVEPETADDATRSFRTGTLQTVHNPPTIADGTRTTSLGELTFPLVLEYVDDMVTVSEEAIKEAVRFAFYRLKLVVEPSGALGLAALLSGLDAGQQAGIILSGGNIDGPTMRAVLA
ncbi:MAG: threo-3-hydroxy-L-aspartate ammonia-lyase [Caldilineaceae bacterium]|nr:threo-3-hydroxy-L-aspartate ammonia-lyase [Caldilineaceae bacterium]